MYARIYIYTHTQTHTYIYVYTEIAARGNSDASADTKEASPNTDMHGRWNPTLRLLCAALELPYWALPAQVCVYVHMYTYMCFGVQTKI